MTKLEPFLATQHCLLYLHGKTNALYLKKADNKPYNQDLLTTSMDLPETREMVISKLKRTHHYYKKFQNWVVVHTCNPTTWVAEAGRLPGV